MLMSKSRLEKFLYALYSLDSSDLPNPISRIEELYKCWVTGEEAPTFEPLSRVEKYLMAIMGLYDLETQVEQRVLCTENNDVIVDENENYICLDEVTSGGIPAPISRIEKLLYKLAIGDDNLDDIKSFLSKHEELLAEIIRNGGVGGNIDIEYVLYTLSTEFNTLYNTTEKPIKSAILKGNTLVNLMITGEKTKTATGSYVGMFEPSTSFAQELKTNTQYLYIVDIIETTLVGGNKAIEIGNTDGGQLSAFTNNVKFPADSKGMLKCVLTTRDSFNGIFTVLRNQLNGNAKSGSITYRQMLIEYQDGMENWDIPYFEGIKSVQMPVLKTTGKNLFDNEFKTSSYASGKAYFPNGTMTSVAFPHTTTNISRGIASIIKVKPNTNYSVSISNKPETGVLLGSGYENIDDMSTASNAVLTVGSVGNDTITTRSFTTTSNCNYMVIGCYAKYEQNTTNIITFNEAPNIQLEVDPVATEYEPYKSNILTTSEEVELRGIGDVKDELDLVTGEVTQRIGEVVFDGSEYWAQSGMGGSPMFYTSLNDMAHKMDYLNSISCDKLTTYVGEAPLNESASPNGIAGYIDVCGVYPNENWIYLKCADSGDSVEKLKQWLSQNPITVQYELTTPVAKTVDISVVNQDGNNTELGTFDDLTHVILSSEGLIPEAELEVATKNEEVLDTMSLEMDDIFTTQTTLGETVNTQSENVDATMIATTEIYEGLL